MKRAVQLAVIAALSCGLSGCGGFFGPGTWQVVGVYTDASLPGELPADAAGKANFQIRGNTIRGTTPCAAVEGSLDTNTKTTRTRSHFTRSLLSRRRSPTLASAAHATCMTSSPSC